MNPLARRKNVRRGWLIHPKDLIAKDACRIDHNAPLDRIFPACLGIGRADANDPAA